VAGGTGGSGPRPGHARASSISSISLASCLSLLFALCAVVMKGRGGVRGRRCGRGAAEGQRRGGAPVRAGRGDEVPWTRVAFRWPWLWYGCRGARVRGRKEWEWKRGQFVAQKRHAKNSGEFFSHTHTHTHTRLCLFRARAHARAHTQDTQDTQDTQHTQDIEYEETALWNLEPYPLHLRFPCVPAFLVPPTSPGAHREYHAKNVGIREAAGDFILVTNPDILFRFFFSMLRVFVSFLCCGFSFLPPLLPLG